MGAAHDPSKWPKFQRGPLCASDASGARVNETLQSAAIQITLFQCCSVPKQCGLTGRSTGHFVAGRVWASFHFRPNPARHKMPVSYNVRPHIYRAVPRHRPRKQNNANVVFLQDCNLPKRDLAPQACQAARNKLDHRVAQKESRTEKLSSP